MLALKAKAARCPRSNHTPRAAEPGRKSGPTWTWQGLLLALLRALSVAAG
jgi:hypothetical protein